MLCYMEIYKHNYIYSEEFNENIRIYLCTYMYIYFLLTGNTHNDQSYNTYKVDIL